MVKFSIFILVCNFFYINCTAQSEIFSNDITYYSKELRILGIKNSEQTASERLPQKTTIFYKSNEKAFEIVTDSLSRYIILDSKNFDNSDVYGKQYKVYDLRYNLTTSIIIKIYKFRPMTTIVLMGSSGKQAVEFIIHETSRKLLD